MAHRGNTSVRAVSRSTLQTRVSSAQSNLDQLVAYMRRAVETREDGARYRPLLERLEEELER